MIYKNKNKAAFAYSKAQQVDTPPPNRLRKKIRLQYNSEKNIFAPFRFNDSIHDELYNSIASFFYKMFSDQSLLTATGE